MTEEDENRVFKIDGLNIDEEIVELSKADKEFIMRNIGLKQEVYNVTILSPKNKFNEIQK